MMGIIADIWQKAVKPAFNEVKSAFKAAMSPDFYKPVTTLEDIEKEQEKIALRVFKEMSKRYEDARCDGCHPEDTGL